jgi:hypothetical protein
LTLRPHRLPCLSAAGPSFKEVRVETAGSWAACVPSGGASPGLTLSLRHQRYISHTRDAARAAAEHSCMTARRTIALRYLVLALGLSLSACAAPSNSGPSPSASHAMPESGYLLRATDGSWYLFIEVRNGKGTAHSAAYEAATNQVSISDGSVVLTNGVIKVTGITNNPWFANGCDCRYQRLSSGTLIATTVTTSGIQKWRFNPAEISEYSAGVQALRNEQQTLGAAAGAEATTQAVMAKELTTCERLGGTWRSSAYTYVCSIDYKSPVYGSVFHYTVTFDAGGNIIPDACSDNAFAFSTSKDCRTTPESVQQAHTDCLNGSANAVEQGYWHADTDICSL